MKGEGCVDSVVHAVVGGTDGGSAKCDVGAEGLAEWGSALFVAVLAPPWFQGGRFFNDHLFMKLFNRPFRLEHRGLFVRNAAKSSWPARTGFADSIDADC